MSPGFSRSMGMSLDHLKKISPGVVLFLLFFSIFSLTMSGSIQYGDEIEKYRVAQSIVERLQFSFRPTEVRNVTGVGGETYSIYELGQTLLQVPLYALGKAVYSFFPTPDPNWITMLFAGLLNPLLTALTCVVLFKTGLAIGFRYQTALILALLLGLGTIAWPYSRGFTREPLLAFLLLSSFYAAYLFQKTLSARWLLVAGVTTGYLAFSKLIHAVIIPVILGYLLFVIFQECRRTGANARQTLLATLRSLGVFLLPAVVLLVLQSLYALARFGSFYIGIAGTRVNPLEWILYVSATSQPITATIGLILSPEKGVFLYSPPTLLFVIGWFRWLRGQTKEAVLVLLILVVEFLTVITRLDWDGGSWWGPRYLVQITPLLLIPIGFLLESANPAARQVWRIVLGVLLAVGLFVQVVGALSDDRDHMDITGVETSLAGQLDFLRRGAIDSLALYLSPTGFPIQINPYGVLIAITVVFLGIWIIRWMRQTPDSKPSYRASWGFLALVWLVEFGGFIFWIVAPYPQVIAAKGNTRFVAANRLLADGKKCEATALYLMALDRQTAYQRQAAEQIEHLWPRATGERIAVDDLRQWVEEPEGTSVEDDAAITLTGEGSTRFSAVPGEDAIVSIVSQPVPAQPNTLYELSGWIKGDALYGTGYAVVTILEDDGNWGDRRTSDIRAMDETHGWQPFRKSITTLPTTRRLFLKSGLYKTYGTFWVDAVALVRVDARAVRPAAIVPPCKSKAK